MWRYLPGPRYFPDLGGQTRLQTLIVVGMAGNRGAGRRARHRSRGAAILVVSAVVLLAVLAGVGVVSYLRSRGSSGPQGRQLNLPTKITETQAIGLANPGHSSQEQASSSPATLLYAGGSGLLFTPSSNGQSVQPSQQWQANQMGNGGQFVLLFSPDGLCLTAVGNRARATAQLDHCDSGLDQRWYHPYLHTNGSGQGYWQLHSASTGRCLAVGTAADSSGAAIASMQRCSAAKPPAQLIMFWSAY
jgi:Ricin-type beta-trefoil lectin domain-like